MPFVRRSLRIACCSFALGLAAIAAHATRPYPILFVTQVPTPGDFTGVASVFGNHHPDMESTPRGGDLYILYPDGSLKNLTGLALFGLSNGNQGFQGASSIAVRDPAVSWDGTKAIFSMVVGAPTQRYQQATFLWQLYEVTGLQAAQTPVITKVANQPANANNVSPIYLSDGRILFTSDRPRDGAPHLYPQLDEYEEAPTVSGIWTLDPATGRLELLDHAPSGDFKPTIDSFGRVIFTRWDHLQRDQQADAGSYGTFNWSSEAPTSVPVATSAEIFPEPRFNVGNVNGHTFNQFFPWMMNQDGTGLETLNHVGRHDLAGYFNRSFEGDGNLHEFICGGNACGRVNQAAFDNLLQIRESPTAPGHYYGVTAPEFYTHAGGQLVWLPGEPGRKPDNMPVTEITHPATSTFTDGSDLADPCHSGFYREPLPLSDNTLIVVHAGLDGTGHPETHADHNAGTRQHPVSLYKFRLRGLVDTNSGGNCAGFKQYGATLTPGFTKTLWFWDPDERVDYDVNQTLWELDPVEVRPRTAPPATGEPVPAIEAAVFAQDNVDLARFQMQLAESDLALIVSRNVTTRDHDDRQQPWQLRVPGGVQTPDAQHVSGTVYDVNFLQLYQGDQIRGLGGVANPRGGRRVLAQVMHDPGVAAHGPPSAPGGPPSSVAIASDGSMVAMVPSHRALTWQLTNGATPVVRERYWLTFKGGEVRVCTSCHGLSSTDQTGATTPQNAPAALHQFLHWWTSVRPELFSTGFELGSTAVWSTKSP